jgi:hypothetical protein
MVGSFTNPDDTSWAYPVKNRRTDGCLSDQQPNDERQSVDDAPTVIGQQLAHVLSGCRALN